MSEIESYLAYIDGSHHETSKTSGWGFIVEKDGLLYKTAFGQIPSEWISDFENYAFAKLIEFCVEEKIEKIEVKTDCFQLKKQLLNLSQKDLIKEVQKYIGTLQLYSNQKLIVNCEHIERKKNKIADKYSRQYLVELLTKQKQDFEKEFENNRVNGNPKHPKIDFFKTTKLSFCSRVAIKSAEQKVLFAARHDCLIFELGKYRKENGSFLKIMLFHKKVYTIIEEIHKINLSEDEIIHLLFDKMLEYSQQYKSLFLSLSEERNNLFNQLTGIQKNDLEMKINSKLVVLLNNIEKLFIYEKSLTNKRREKKPKIKMRNLSLVEKEKLYGNKALMNKKYLNIILGEQFQTFKQTYEREPTIEERDKIKQETIVRLQRQD